MKFFFCLKLLFAHNNLMETANFLVRWTANWVVIEINHSESGNIFKVWVLVSNSFWFVWLLSYITWFWSNTNKLIWRLENLIECFKSLLQKSHLLKLLCSWQQSNPNRQLSRFFCLSFSKSMKIGFLLMILIYYSICISWSV